MRKASESFAKCDVDDHCVMLLPARTDTRWWESLITADALLFWRGRLRFVGAPAPAPFPSVIAYWGHCVTRSRGAFAPHGWMVEK